MAAPIPHEALARAVRVAFGGAARIVAAEALAGDASSRSYLRLRLGGGNAPATAVAMLLPAAARASDELGDTPGGEELPFLEVGAYLARHGLPVPAVHRAAPADGLLLLEDVGDATLWSVVEAAPERAPVLFGAAVDLLVALQAAGARDPDPACIAFRRRFNGRLARAELVHFVEHGIETRRAGPLAPAARAAILAALEPLAEPFESAAAVLAHRDYMAWNIHVRGDRLTLLDFQDALLAPDAFDLAQLLTDRTTAAVVTPPLEQALVARFLAGRRAAGLPVGGDFARRYRLCALQHALKVIGRFYFLERVQGKPGYLAYLPAVYAVARRLFAELPELAPARALLAPHLPELAAPP